MKSRNALDLCSGIGGLAMGLKHIYRIKGYVEIDKYCRNILRKNMDAGLLDRAPIHKDVTNMAVPTIRNLHAIICGFPCQDISGIGKKQGFQGDKSSLFFSIMKIVRDLQPNELFLENVASITTFPEVWKVVLAQLRDAGYNNCRWLTLKASDVGAPHQRNRWFCLAYKKLPVFRNPLPPPPKSDTFNSWWKPDGRRPEPRGVRRLVPRMEKSSSHQHRALGNAVVPLQAETAAHYLYDRWAPSSSHEWKYSAGRLPKWGELKGGKIYSCVSMVSPTLTSKRFTLVPPKRVHPKSKRWRKRAREEGRPVSDLVMTKKRTSFWPTPRAYGGSHRSQILTRRGSRDIGTFLGFEKETTRRERDGGKRASPEILEWMMGFPREYTRV